jgi:hypothetical protein
MKNGKNIRGALSYNEAKVRAGEAELILAARFGCEASELSFSQKLNRFEKLNQKCIRSRYNTLHISLNFHPDEKITPEQMQDIAQEYMQQLEFEKQPYLVYRHDDAGHPHLHIVTTPVKPNGSFISLHNLVQRKSEPARKNIEISYGLLKAEGRNQNQSLSDFSIRRAEYGKAQTKHLVSQIVRSVMQTYRFTSLEEYKLILKGYGIIADTGAPDTRLNRFGGIQYFLMDGSGNKTGVPIKASSIYENPILKNIESKFAKNQTRKTAGQPFTRNNILYCCRQSRNRQQFTNLLYERKIRLTGDTHGNIVFIDHKSKNVFTAQELGIEREVQKALDWIELPSLDLTAVSLSLLEQLAATAYSGAELSVEFLKRKKKKKKK